MTKKQTLITATLLLTFIGFAKTHAQDSLKHQNISEVKIEDNYLQIPFSKNNRSVIILDSKDIESLPIKSLNELLTYISGIDIRQRSPWGGQADISINGGTFDETLILLNGIKIMDPQTGHLMMNLPINPELIKRVEVLKGPAAGVYGINAMCGAINIITKTPTENNLIIQLTGGSSFEKDSSNNKLYAALKSDIIASLANKKINQILFVSTTQSSGYRYNTALENYKIYYQNELKTGKQENKIEFQSGYIYNHFGANGFYAAPGDIESTEGVQTFLSAIKGTFRIKDNWVMLPSISYRNNHDDYVYVRQNPDLYHNIHATNLLNITVQNKISLNSGGLGFGVEYLGENIRSNSLGNRARGNYGIYANYHFAKQKFIANLGSYVNYNQNFSWNILPSLDVGYEFKECWQVFLNAGIGARIPTYTDLYYHGPQNIGNSNLQPEKSMNFEGGIRYNNNKTNLLLSGFNRKITDMIDWVKDSLNAPWQTQNFSQLNTLGISLDANYSFEFPNVQDWNLSSRLSYTWLKPMVKDPIFSDFHYSHYALENLSNQLILGLNSTYKKRYSMSLTGRLEDRINNSTYILLDAQLSASFNSVQAILTLNNLTNQTYISAGTLPMPGRWIDLGIKWQLK